MFTRHECSPGMSTTRWGWGGQKEVGRQFLSPHVYQHVYQQAFRGMCYKMCAQWEPIFNMTKTLWQGHLNRSFSLSCLNSVWLLRTNSIFSCISTQSSNAPDLFTMECPNLSSTLIDDCFHKPWFVPYKSLDTDNFRVVTCYTAVNTCSCSFCMVRSFPRIALSCTIRLCSSSMLSSSSLPMRYCSFISWFLSSPVICGQSEKRKNPNKNKVSETQQLNCWLYGLTFRGVFDCRA